MNCKDKEMRAPRKFKAILSMDLVLVLLFLALTVMTMAFRESALRHVRAQLEEGAIVAVKHFALEVDNRWVAGLTAGEQIWWSDAIERILSVDQRVTGMTVFSEDGKVIASHEHRLAQNTFRYFNKVGSGMLVQIEMDSNALTRVESEFDRFMVVTGMLFLLYLGVRLLQGGFLRPRKVTAVQKQGAIAAATKGEHTKIERSWRQRESERELVARELHEHFSQSLSSVMIRLGMLPREQGSQDLTLNEMRQVLAESITDMNVLARRLWPNVLHDLGLQPALKSLVRDFRLRTGMDADLLVDQQGDWREPIPRETGLLAYRLVQEVLEKVALHMSTAQITINCCLCSTELSLRIKVWFDNEPEVGKNWKDGVQRGN